MSYGHYLAKDGIAAYPATPPDSLPEDALSIAEQNAIIKRTIRKLKITPNHTLFPRPVSRYCWEPMMPTMDGPKMLNEGGMCVVLYAMRSDGREFYVKTAINRGRKMDDDEVVDAVPQLISSALTRLNTHLDRRCTCTIPPAIQTCPVQHYPPSSK